MIVNGVEGKSYDYADSETVTFGPDAKHFAYFASRDGEGFIVVDGVEAEKTYQDATGVRLPRLIFDGPTSLRTLGLRDGRIYRVEIRIIVQ